MLRAEQAAALGNPKRTHAKKARKVHRSLTSSGENRKLALYVARQSRERKRIAKMNSSERVKYEARRANRKPRGPGRKHTKRPRVTASTRIARATARNQLKLFRRLNRKSTRASSVGRHLQDENVKREYHAYLMNLHNANKARAQKALATKIAKMTKSRRAKYEANKHKRANRKPSNPRKTRKAKSTGLAQRWKRQFGTSFGSSSSIH